MHEILEKERLSPEICRVKLKAPQVARNYRPGQFIVVRIDERGERIPLTIVERDAGRGTIDIIFQLAGKTTTHLSTLGVGSYVRDVLGPLGHPSEIKKYGTCVAVGGGVGSAEVLPIVRALREAGNRVISIIGARTKELLMLEDEFRAASDEVIVTTDDGSHGKEGFVTHALSDLMEREKIDLVHAVGPVIMMRKVAEMTMEPNIRTHVSLSTLMLDATGLCGVCRCTVGGEVKFACCDGPEFNGHKVDFDELARREKMYTEFEAVSFEKFRKDLGT